VARELSKARLCKQLGAFQAASSHQLEATRRAAQRYSPMPTRAPRSLWKEYEQSLDQARTQRQEAWGSYRHAASRERQQLALRQTIETRALKRKLAIQRKAIQKTWHPGTWRHFVASRAAHRDARAIRLLQRRERERGRSNEEREL
jgi:hypothetical protein